MFHHRVDFVARRRTAEPKTERAHAHLKDCHSDPQDRAASRLRRLGRRAGVVVEIDASHRQSARALVDSAAVAANTSLERKAIVRFPSPERIAYRSPRSEDLHKTPVQLI